MAKYGSLPPQATRCDPSLPIHIELVPLNEARAGQTFRFQVQLDSILDPDLVKDSWIEYSLPPSVRRLNPSLERGPAFVRAGTTRRELAIVIPDTQRHEIRARVVVELVNGRKISQTAVRWINPDGSVPEGYLGRIIDQTGNGIRVYQGLTER